MAPLPAALEGLEPADLWRLFATLSEIPRPSKQEEKVMAWLKGWADEKGLAWQQVSAGPQRRGGGGQGDRPQAHPPLWTAS